MTALDYIESNGKQYINTGIVADTNTSFYIDAFVSNYGQPRHAAPFGAYYSGNRQIIFQSTVSSNPRFVISWGTTQTEVSYNITWQRFRATFEHGRAVVMDMQGNTLCDVSATVGTSFPTTPIWLFGLSGLSTDHTCAMKLYGFKIYQNGVLVRDFRPALDENGVICLWDAVTQSYFYNAGTGAFAGGARDMTPQAFNKKMFLSGLVVGRKLWQPPAINTARPIVAIRVTTLPSNLIYNDGDLIDYSGMVVTAYGADGVAIRVLPNDVLVKPSEADCDENAALLYHNAAGTVVALYCEKTYQYTANRYVYPHPLGTKNGVQYTIACYAPGVDLLTRWNWPNPTYGGLRNWGLNISGDRHCERAEIRNGSYSIVGTTSARTGYPTFDALGSDGYWGDLPLSTADPRGLTLADMSGRSRQQRITVSYTTRQGITLTDSFSIAVDAQSAA